jgi:hypothetical protein
MTTGSENRWFKGGLLAAAFAINLVVIAPAYAQSDAAGGDTLSSDEGSDSQLAPLLPPPPGECTGETLAPAPVPAEKFATSPGGVDMRTGMYQYSHVDLTIGGEGDAGLSLERTTQSDDSQWLGQYFSHNWDIHLTMKRVEVCTANDPSEWDYQVSVFYGGLGSTFRGPYAPTPVQFRQISNERKAQLSYAGSPGTGSYTFIANDGTEVVFRPLTYPGDCVHDYRCAYASQITRPDGTIYTLSYDNDDTGMARLRRVQSNRGYEMIFEYNASSYPYTPTKKICAFSDAYIASPSTPVCPSGSAQVSYTYSGQYLASYTDARGKVYNYSIAGTTTKTMKFFEPGQSSPQVTVVLDTSSYTKPAVTSQQFADGSSYTYSWDLAGGTAPYPAGGSFTDNLGHTVDVQYGQYHIANSIDPTMLVTPGPETITDQLNRTITADYCTPNPATQECVVVPPESVTDAEGIKRSFTYDTYRNITETVTHAKPGSGLADITTSAVFGNCPYFKACAKPTATTDGRGHTTNYTYWVDASHDHGGIRSELDPAAATGGTRPGKYYTYVQRYAWIKSGASYVHASSPVWLLSRMTTCRTTAISATTGACGGGTADQIKTTYEYGPDSGPNNLLLRGVAVTAEDAGGVSRTYRTCYGYDAQGNKISETKPRAGLSSCP